MNLTGVNCVMAVLGFAVSTVFIAFVCIRIIAARIQLAASRRTFLMSTRTDPSSLECGLRGLEPHVVATYPTKTYSDTTFSSSDDSQCVICLAEYYKKDTIRILPYCGHIFHIVCIGKWLSQHSTCPVCRFSLRELSIKTKMPPMLSSSIRPYYHTDSHDFNPYFVSTIIDHPMRAPVDRRVDPILENLIQTERQTERLGVEEGDSVSIVIESSKNKHTESPSTT